MAPKKSKTNAKADVAPAARGTGPIKRTPTSHFDPLINSAETLFEVEAIVGEGVSKKKGEEPGIIFLVKWRNYNASHNSWEPLLGLAGLEDMIEVYREKRKKENAAAIEAEETRRALEPARDAGGVPLRDELEEYLTEAPLVLAEEADQAFSVKGIFEYWLSKVGRCKLNPG
jgi:hypothetical protein